MAEIIIPSILYTRNVGYLEYLPDGRKILPNLTVIDYFEKYHKWASENNIPVQEDELPIQGFYFDSNGEKQVKTIQAKYLRDTSTTYTVTIYGVKFGVSNKSTVFLPDLYYVLKQDENDQNKFIPVTLDQLNDGDRILIKYYDHISVSFEITSIIELDQTEINDTVKLILPDDHEYYVPIGTHNYMIYCRQK